MLKIGEYCERGVRVRHSEAVVARGVESDNIKFRDIPETKVLRLYHKGVYDAIGAAYAHIYQYAEDNGYEIAGLSCECYIDGIWNKDSVDEWLTEVQLPVKQKSPRVAHSGMATSSACCTLPCVESMT